MISKILNGDGIMRKYWMITTELFRNAEFEIQMLNIMLRS